ncbi:unnamed protein product, partial [Amoebophrya sp. A25]|eukprot:GSA25T00015853001.1
MQGCKERKGNRLRDHSAHLVVGCGEIWLPLKMNATVAEHLPRAVDQYYRLPIPVLVTSTDSVDRMQG